MKIKIYSGAPQGIVTAPASKSVAHRMLISASLCSGESRISGISTCDDVLATIDCLNKLGAKITLCGDVATVIGFDPREASPSSVLFANESGSTLRFLLPLAFLSGAKTHFSGAGRLMERPMAVYEELCKKNGIEYTKDSGIISVCGKFSGQDIEVPGDISSQFITGLLFILPFLGGDRRIKITTKLESRSYIDLTLKAMQDFGVAAEWESADCLLVRTGSVYTARDISVEGDYSAAAFPAALNLMGGDVSVLGLREDSLQGDKVYCEAYEALKSGFAEISIENCPDLGPILFTVAAACNGGRFTDTARLRIKESDRAACMAMELRKFGVQIEVFENSVTVKKAELHAPIETLFGHNDHRVVMSLACLATKFGAEIEGAEAINKSYPAFFDDLSSLGIRLEKI